MPLGSAGEALVHAVGGAGIGGAGAERGFCDSGDTGADVSAGGLASEGVGITGGTCASVEEGDALLGDAIGGASARDGVDDGLFADGNVR